MKTRLGDWFTHPNGNSSIVHTGTVWAVRHEPIPDVNHGARGWFIYRDGEPFCSGADRTHVWRVSKVLACVAAEKAMQGLGVAP